MHMIDPKFYPPLLAPICTGIKMPVLEKVLVWKITFLGSSSY